MRSAFAAGVLFMASTGIVEAQQRSDSTGKTKGSITLTPGANYDGGALERILMGNGWRDVWTTPVSAPVLDMETQDGGLELERRGGGFHSRVLHLKEDEGWREFRFRSVDKFPMQGSPPELPGTLAGRIFHDVVVTPLFPGAPLIVPPLLEAVGVLHVTPRLYVMGDSPRLKAQRDTFAGMLGTYELKIQEGPDDKPGIFGTRKVKGTDNFLEDIAKNRGHRLDERELLAARLVDILVNDPDRSPDNYDWARFGEKGAYTWRPVPLDRDQAFINADGLMNKLIVRRLYPKQIPFGPSIRLKGLTYSTHFIDRRLLQRLTADDFRDVSFRVQRAITDDVIARAVAQLPASWRERTRADEEIESALRSRRDQLPAVAMAFYRQLAEEVDIHGTDEADRLDVVRHADGRVTVTITEPEQRPLIAQRADGGVVTTNGGEVSGAAIDLFFTRTFNPGETKELRLYARGGDDVAVVRGRALEKGIVVRIIGGKGNDMLADSAGGDLTSLYDAEGSNRLTAAEGTHVDTRPWKESVPRTAFVVGESWRPDWGGGRRWTPVVDYNTGSGLILGIGPRFKDRGFRRLPFHWEAGAALMVGTGDGRVGATADVDYRAENAPRAFRIAGKATQLEATRFFGYGNNTSEVGRDLSVVKQNVFALEPSAVWFVGWRAREDEGNALRGTDSTRFSGLRPMVGEVRLGPVLGWVDPEPRAGSPLLASGVTGADGFALAGAQFGLELDRTDDDAIPTRGFTFKADAGAYPALLGVADAFGTARARATLYVPLVAKGPHLAFRAGGSVASGDYPAQYAATVGGRSSLRGYSWHRFAGDRAAHGSAELRVPVGTVNFFVKSKLGVFALADAGRVWYDGASEGGWHTGTGGGFWLSAFGRSVSLAYVRGESPKFYISSGLFY